MLTSIKSFSAYTSLVVPFILISANALAEPQKNDKMKFETKSFSLGKEKIAAEVAETEEQLEYGLMFRNEKLPPNKGMIFIFGDEQTRTFWMKNTYIPLSVGFFDHTGALVDIQEMDAVSQIDQGPYAQYASKKPAQFVLEMNKNWFVDHHIALKTRLSPIPKLHEGRDPK